MRRREFLGLLSGVSVTLWPLPLSAQKSTKIPRLGVLLYSTLRGDPNTESFPSRHARGWLC
jgi:hypothetical protein